MPQLLNNRWEKFCHAYFRAKSAVDAAIEAGYTPKAASYLGSKLLKNGQIQDRIKEIKQNASAPKIMSVRERKELLSEIARTRLSDFVKCDGGIAHISIGPDSIKNVALQKTETRMKYGEDGDMTAAITEIKLYDTLKAIDVLNKMEGQYQIAKANAISEETDVTQIVFIMPDGSRMTPEEIGDEHKGNHTSPWTS